MCVCVGCMCSMCVRGVCVYCACGGEPHGEGLGKPRLKIMGLSHLEEWKVLERETGSEARDGGEKD